MRPDQAIIPAAGKGTRLRPTTRWVPKELIPVGNAPMLLHVLREAIDAGMREIVLVISPQKPALKQFHSDLPRLDEQMSKERVRTVSQETPAGLADALRLGWQELNQPDEPVCSLLPDNIYLQEGSSPADLLCNRVNGQEDHLSILHPIQQDQLDEYGYPGIPDLEPVSDGRFRITGLPDKGVTSVETNSRPLYRLAGRSLLFPSFFETLNDIEQDLRQKGQELDDVPVVQSMIEQERNVQCITFDERVHDTGHTAGLKAAWEAVGQ